MGRVEKSGQGPGVRFLKVPKIFRARKAIRKTPTRLFGKAGSYFVKGIKIKTATKCLEKRIMSPEMRPKSFGTFEKHAPLSRKSREHFRARKAGRQTATLFF